MISRLLYDELVYGGHLLAVGTASIAAAAATIAGFVPSIQLELMAYLFTYGAYTMNRVSEPDQDAISHPKRTSYLSGRRKFMPFISIACFVGGYALALERNFYFFAALLLPLFLSIVYSVGSRRMERTIGVRRLKEKILVKNLVISFGWSLIPLLVGLYYRNVPLALLVLSPFIFLRFMENTIFFDVRDVEGDIAYGTRTIPSAFGEPATSKILNVLDSVSLVYMTLAIATALLPVLSFPLAIFPLYSFAYRRASTEANANVIRDFFADGEYVLWMPVILLGKI